MNTWADLRSLRQAGMKPSLPLVVTVDGKRPAKLLSDEGCLVITHKPGEQFPVELLDGLRVWLFVGGCGRGQAVMMLASTRGVKPAYIASWCECGGFFDHLPVGCDVAREWQ